MLLLDLSFQRTFNCNEIRELNYHLIFLFPFLTNFQDFIWKWRTPVSENVVLLYKTSHGTVSFFFARPHAYLN